MRNPGGYVSISAPDKESQKIILNGTVIDSEVECDTYSCGHCNVIVPVKPMCDPADIGGLCKSCMALVCPHCYATGECTPIMKRVEQAEDRQRFLRQMQEWA